MGDTAGVTETVQLPDGRRIGYAVFGVPLEHGRGSSGHVVFALHGTPGSRLKYRPADGAAKARGLTLVALDRWGYGLTDAHPSPSLAAFADDVRGVAAALGVQRFSICGISGGGPFASAGAVLLGKQVRKAALVAPVGPIAPDDDQPHVPRLDWFHWFVFRALPRLPALVWLVFRFYRRCLKLAPRLAIAFAMARNGPADKVLLSRPVVVSSLVAMMRAGLDPQGVRGPMIDLKLFGLPWRLPFENAEVEVRVWFGDQDLSVAATAVERLANAMPNAKLERLEAQGHFWIATRFDVVLDWLAAPDEAAAGRGDAGADHAEQAARL